MVMTSAPKTKFMNRGTPPHILTLVLLAGLSALSMNIFLPSLPNMTEYFNADYRVMQLSVALYLAVTAVLQIVIGPLSDLYGRRPVIIAGTTGFVVATLGCMLSPTVEIFLAFRMAQAVIASAMVLSRAIVRDIVPQDEAASMIGYVTMGMSIVPMVGPTIGGFLDETFGWQANFGILLIVGLIVAVIAWFDLGETARPGRGSLRAQLSEYPELFTSRRFWGYVLSAAFASGAFFAFLGGAPFVGTEVFGLSPSSLGLYFAPAAVGYMFGNFITGRYSVRLGIDRMMLAGSLVTTVGLCASLVLFWAGATHPMAFFGLLATVGIGNGMVLPNSTSGMLSVRPHLAGTASGLGGAIMIGGGAALSALAGALLVPGAGPYPLIGLMLTSSVCAIIATLYVSRINRITGGLPDISHP